MKNNVTLNGNINSAYYSDQVLKLTSLIYLEEALLAQDYENCAALIREAKSFGAEQSEISALLAGKKANEAKTNNQGRSRF